jgi:hypothetical protein
VNCAGVSSNYTLVTFGGDEMDFVTGKKFSDLR